ncbi:acyltransferase [Bradyrhizobium sp. 173]|uniref:acyltransferase n=1 Tax=Bradyrhizobium sp. 173 TaxID=2782644 RepID=UPI0023EE6D21|nr:DapH/DapD/GlmU-related protein [Bradyrhizobium sp. 173]MCK1564122.1 acyltransferase [Bradyrhizobium sp. 173]
MNVRSSKSTRRGGWSRLLGAVYRPVLVTFDSAVFKYWQIRLGSVGPDTRIYPTVRIYRPSSVHVGANSVLNDFVHIWGAEGVYIGNNTLIASHTVITSQTHDVNALASGKLYRETNTGGPITIGNNVWIGSNAVILPGVTVGDGSIVGAGAVVTRDIAAGTLVMGIPARVVRHLK